jgi:hypothetical protein
VADSTLTWLSPLLLDLRVELFKLLDGLLRLLQQILSLLQLPLSLHNVVLVVTSRPRLQLSNLPLINLDHDAVTSNPHLDRVEELLERSGAEKLDVLTRRTGTCEDVVVVSFLACLEEDVTTGKTNTLSLWPPSAK